MGKNIPKKNIQVQDNWALGQVIYKTLTLPFFYVASPLFLQNFYMVRLEYTWRYMYTVNSSKSACSDGANEHDLIIQNKES